MSVCVVKAPTREDLPERLGALAGELIVESWIRGVQLSDEILQELCADAAVRLDGVDLEDLDQCARLAEKIVEEAIIEGRIITEELAEV